MTGTLSGCVVTLALLFVWRGEHFAEACSCAPAHPQQAFCHSDVVIRAKVIAVNKVNVGSDVYGNQVKRLKYDLKLIKTFKGPSQDIDAAYTAPISSLCGVTLDVEGQLEYLIMGKLETNGTLYINRCDSLPCTIHSETDCLWTDWLVDNNVNGNQAKHFACIQRRDGSCAWYRGTAPPKQGLPGHRGTLTPPSSAESDSDWPNMAEDVPH
ncbi:hypothetical protein CRUP_008255, partial [Coryphaenoides rupestris]